MELHSLRVFLAVANEKSFSRAAEKLLRIIREYKRYLDRFEGSFDDNPSPGNKAGGLTNILEKSLGAVAKSGSSPLIDVYEYAERISAPGFCFMNTPGYDQVSLTGLAAGGCNMIAFTTGRGSAIGFPTIPVIKIATNTNTYRRMQDNMDVNAGAITDGEKSVQQVGLEIFRLLLEVASGHRTCAERLGHVAVPRFRHYAGDGCSGLDQVGQDRVVLGLDPGTVAAWERDEIRRPYPLIRAVFEDYLRRREVSAEP